MFHWRIKQSWDRAWEIARFKSLAYVWAVESHRSTNIGSYTLVVKVHLTIVSVCDFKVHGEVNRPALSSCSWSNVKPPVQAILKIRSADSKIPGNSSRSSRALPHDRLWPRISAIISANNETNKRTDFSVSYGQIAALEQLLIISLIFNVCNRGVGLEIRMAVIPPNSCHSMICYCLRSIYLKNRIHLDVSGSGISSIRWFTRESRLNVNAFLLFWIVATQKPNDFRIA